MTKRLLGGAWDYLLRAGVIFAVFAKVYMDVSADGLEIDGIGKMFMIIFGSIALFNLMLALMIVLKNKQQYARFFKTFPEIGGQLDRVEQDATYVNHDIGLLIYKDHLVSYRYGSFAFVDLYLVSKLTYISRWGGFRRPSDYFIEAQLADQQASTYKLPLKTYRSKEAIEQVNAVYQVIAKDFPTISYE